MKEYKANTLLVIERGKCREIALDDRQSWMLGRATMEKRADIMVYSPTVSRDQGCFKNMNGVWFYTNHGDKNRTYCNGRMMCRSATGRVRPHMLKHGDVFLFGGGEKPAVNEKTIWALYTERCFGEGWRTVHMDTAGMVEFSCGEDRLCLDRPEPGEFWETQEGMAFYLGEYCYLSGEMQVKAM